MFLAKFMKSHLIANSTILKKPKKHNFEKFGANKKLSNEYQDMFLELSILSTAKRTNKNTSNESHIMQLEKANDQNQPFLTL